MAEATRSNKVGNAGYGIPFDALVQPLMWSAVLMVVALIVDALGRRKGEPDPPARPDVHAQIERMLRETQLATMTKAARMRKRI